MLSEVAVLVAYATECYCCPTLLLLLPALPLLGELQLVAVLLPSTVLLPAVPTDTGIFLAQFWFYCAANHLEVDVGHSKTFKISRRIALLCLGQDMEDLAEL